MSLSIFDLIGPVMMGPSSSHTAGAARIGFLVHQMVKSEIEEITLYFHPVLIQTYSGHRTHAALVAGLLGYREDDPQGVQALHEANKKGINLYIEQIDEDVHQNTMRIKVKTKSGILNVNGVSVGGGSILITEIDGTQVKFDGNSYVVIERSATDISELTINQLSDFEVIDYFAGRSGDRYMQCWTVRKPVDDLTLNRLKGIKSLSSIQVISPLYDFRQTNEETPLFSTLDEMIGLARINKYGLPSVSLNYEIDRSGRTEQEIRLALDSNLKVMQLAIEEGLTGNAELLGGFCAGNDGLKMLKAYQEGKTITGGIFATAIAKALAVMEVNGSMGKIVALPTAGSAGVLPGVLFSIKEKYHKNDEDLVDALLVAGAIGICIANKASLSGAVGGCQGEVGVAAAMSAGAATHLGGGDAEQCAHAAALTLKNLLGLICDPPAGPVEVPCIKRNAIGVSAALMGADMALAGIQSYIPPDEVIDALRNVQEYLPQELKGSTIGGLASTKMGGCMRKEWQKKLAELN
ncbi:MAG: L-serine ammonia-lyase, iron-sulfur-dependent, subunit alpha [Bacillota bacterium]|nr:L-serine ammonia-lyase, iron-sulfur-dependent, subunit alpha [Bacillota bacterium]